MSDIFEFATATRIVVGAGTMAQAPAAIAALGARRALLVTGRSAARAEPLRAALAAAGIEAVPFSIPQEPTVELARAAASVARAQRCDAAIAFGGGSPLDAGKAAAALAANDGDPLDYLEVVGRGRLLERPSLPFVAIPTTAGTGAEVTRNAVLAVPEARVKVSLRSPFMLPRLAIVDPELVDGAPPGVIASSGLDALSQCIEPFVSARANPLTDALAREGMRRSARALQRAYGQASQGRIEAPLCEDLAIASLCGGLALANAGLGAVHGFAAPAGGMFAAPHGAVCAALLPAVMQVNLRAMESRAAGHPSRPRFAEIAALLTGSDSATADDGISWIASLCRTLAIPGLGRHGMTAADVPALVEGAKRASSMRGNPIALTDAELTEIAQRSL